MHQLLKGRGDSASASFFPMMADEVVLLEAAGFHDIKVSLPLPMHACKQFTPCHSK